MEISVKINHGLELVFKFDEISFCKNLEEGIYRKTKEGKIDYKNVSFDVKTDIIENFSSALKDMMYFRKRDFNSSELIEVLFEKLPEQTRNDLVINLIKKHSDSKTL